VLDIRIGRKADFRIDIACEEVLRWQERVLQAIQVFVVFMVNDKIKVAVVFV